MAVKSLGTLTMNVIANTAGFTGPLEKAGKSLQTNTRRMVQDAKTFGLVAAGLSAAVLGASTAVVAFTKAIADNAVELQKQAQVANSSVAEMQAWGAAVAGVGVDTEKFSDIVKDVNDKIGDFAATGGGALTDFFDNIGPKIGVTIQDFQNLSGPQALQLYYDSLRQANVSQQEMTFYMEAIASDATALIPVLRDGGSAVGAMADELARMGLTMSELDIANLQEFSNEFQKMQTILQAVGQTIGSELAPYITELVSRFQDVMSGVNDLDDTIERWINNTLTSIGPILDVFRDIEIAFEATSLAGSQAGEAFAAFFAQVEQSIRRLVNNTIADLNTLGAAMAKIPGLDGFEIAMVDATGFATENLEHMRQQTDALTQSLNDLKAAPAPSEVISGYLEAVDARKQFNELTSTANLVTQRSTGILGENTAATDKNTASTKAANKAKEEANRELERQRDAYENLLDQLYPLQASQKQYTEDLATLAFAYQDGAISADQLADAQQRLREQSAEGLGGFSDAPGFGGLDGAVGGAAGEMLKLGQAQEQLDEWYAEQLETLAEYRAARADLNEEWNEKEAELNQEYLDRQNEIAAASQVAQLSNMEQTFGSMSDIAKNFAGESSGLYKGLFAVQKAFAIAQSAIAIQQGIAMAAANPWPLNLAAMASVAAATASIVSNIQAISVAGQAHDGIMSVPNSGTWNLEKGERVLPQDTADNLDRTLDDVNRNSERGSNGVTVNLHEDASKAGQVDQSQDADGRDVIDIVVANISREGRIHSTMQRKYRLKSAGQ